MIALFRALEGILLLTLGRKLFWVFVAAIGFEAGAVFAARVFQRQPEWLTLLVALSVGILGAVLAIVLQNVVVGIAGFVAGGVIAAGVLDLLNLDATPLPLIAFVVGGVIGAIWVALLFDWALIGLSSLAGAITLTNVLLPRGAMAIIAIVVLFVVGVMIQVGWLWREKRGAS
ncbi:MAG: DUF4203 domain-containing protein [Chloroflexi bacterium]|nr:DUF4203 domain-containing protein [Chloroflexota bacterium]